MFKIGDEVILTQRLGLVEKGSLGIATNLIEGRFMFKIGDEVILTQRLGLVEKGSLGIVTNLIEGSLRLPTYLVRFSDRTYSLSILVITEYLVIANRINKLLFC